MKKLSTSALLVSFLVFTSCTKEKTTVVSANGDSTTTVTTMGMDNQKVDSAKIKVNKDLNKTNDALEKGANDVKEDLKKATSDAAAAVEKGAKDVKEKTEK
jgi:hypothetical protein